MAHLHRLRDYEKLSITLTENKYGINKTHFRNEPEAAKRLFGLSKIHSSESGSNVQTLRKYHVRAALTFVVQLCPVLVETLQSDFLT